MKTVFPKNAKNARKSQNTPSTNPYQNETQFSPLSLKSPTSRHPRQPKSVICPPVISGTNSRANSLKLAKFRHGTAGLSNVGVSPTGAGGNPSDFRFRSELLQRFGQFVIIDSLAVFVYLGVVCFEGSHEETDDRKKSSCSQYKY